MHAAKQCIKSVWIWVGKSFFFGLQPWKLPAVDCAENVFRDIQFMPGHVIMIDYRTRSRTRPVFRTVWPLYTVLCWRVLTSLTAGEGTSVPMCGNPQDSRSGERGLCTQRSSSTYPSVMVGVIRVTAVLHRAVTRKGSDCGLTFMHFLLYRTQPP